MKWVLFQLDKIATPELRLPLTVISESGKLALVKKNRRDKTVFSGELMSRKILSCSLIALSVAACSSNDPRRASGDFDYAELKEAQQLSIPDNLSKPKEQNEFYIVEESKVRGPIGNQVDVRAPSLVLPIAASSRTVATTTDAVIWYDKVLEDKDLKFFIYQAIEKALVDEDIGLNPIGDDGLSFETDWLHKEKRRRLVYLKMLCYQKASSLDLIY